MDLIVLVKYVADVDNIPEDAWDTERGTLRRNVLTMIANPLDDRALHLGLEIRKERPGKLIVFSMGPPQAEEICRRALAYGADDAVLLSDGAFAGADTLATARTIAAAIRKAIDEGIVSEPLVLAGMQSPDGDTAQVPIQVAAFLGFPVIPYVAALVNGHGDTLEFETLQPRGRARLQVTRPPALVTVTKYISEPPFHTPLHAIRSAAVKDLPVWGRADLGLAETDIGLAGSFTRVVKIFSPEKKDRGAYRVEFGGDTNPLEELPAVLMNLREYLRTGGETENTDAKRSHPVGDAPAYYRGECMVLCERETPGGGDRSDDEAIGRITEGSRELLGVSARLAEQLGTTTTAVLIGPVRPSEITSLAEAGADHLVSVRAELSPAFIPEERARAVVRVVETRRPQLFLLPASLTGRIVAPLIAAQLNAGLTADCTGLEIADYTGRAGGRQVTYGHVLYQTRPALGGNVMATIISLRGRENGSPQMATARPGVFATIARPGNRITVEEFAVDEAAPSGARVISAAERTTETDSADENALEECEVIVSVGVGIGSTENVERLARPLVRALEKAWGVKVGLACSRAAMEAGLMPYSAQVGQTGKTVKPRVYIALGISGAVQHRVGMENAGRILSINSDTDAPLLSYSDYVIRARCEDAVPVLLKLLEDE